MDLGAPRRRPAPRSASNVKHVTAACRVWPYWWSAGREHCHSEDGEMKTRRMAYWWFRFVVSGRFLEKFLDTRRVRPS